MAPLVHGKDSQLSRLRKWLVSGVINAGLILFGIVIAAFITEIVLRVGFREMLQYDGARTHPDELLGWAPNHGFEGDFMVEGKRVRVHFNSRGLRRADDVSYSKPPGIKRVIVIGDSVTAGLEVPEANTFAAQMERLLNQAGEDRYQVLNAGVRGYGTDQALLWLEREGWQYAPDAVIYTAVINDLTDNLCRDKKPYFTLDGDELTLHRPEIDRRVALTVFFVRSLYLARLHRRIRNARRTREPTVGLLRYAETLTEEQRNAGAELLRQRRQPDNMQAEWELWRAIVRRMESDCREHNAELFVTAACVPEDVIPELVEKTTGQSVGPDPYLFHQRVESHCRDLGVEFIPMLPAFVEEYQRSQQWFWFKRDDHYAAPGHALVARTLVRFIRPALSSP